MAYALKVNIYIFRQTFMTQISLRKQENKAGFLDCLHSV